MEKVTTPQAVRKRRKQTAFLLVLCVILVVLGVSALFSLSGKSVRFDSAYDKGQSLEGWFFICRQRLLFMIAGLVCLVIWVVLNKEILYNQNVAPYVFTLPFIFTFLVFFLYPLINTIMMSFQEITATSTEWIGFKNYENMFANKNFWIAVKNSLRYMVITCALLIPFPLLFAYMLNSKTMKFSGFFKAIYFMPVLSSVVVAGIIFRMMFSELPGALMNQVVTLFGGQPLVWLKGEWTAMFAMVLLCCWRWTGMNIL